MSDQNELTFAEYYWDHRNRVISDIVLLTLMRVILQVVGMFGNFAVAISTIQHRQFQSTCGILLASAAVFDTLHQLSHWYFGYLIFTGINFTTLKTCVIVNLVPLIGLSSGMLMVFFIGVDRTLSVLFPTWHRKQSKCKFLSVYFGFSAIYNVFWTVVYWLEMSKNPDKETICLISDAQPGYSGLLWFNFCLVFNVLTILCYFIIWLYVRFNHTALLNQKMLRSLFAITAVVFLGWMLNAAVNVVASYFKLTPVQSWYVGYYVGIMINLAISSNYFLLFVFSHDYRAVFKKQLNCCSVLLFRRRIFRSESQTTIKPTTQAFLSSEVHPKPQKI